MTKNSASWMKIRILTLADAFKLNSKQKKSTQRSALVIDVLLDLRICREWD